MTQPPTRIGLKSFLGNLLAVGMVWIGIDHFRNAAFFDSIIPSWLPAHHALTLISGFFEIAGGIGLVIPRLRHAAALGLAALYIAVFPANINMALHPSPTYGHTAIVLLWLRLPLQFVLIQWAIWLSRG
jgi:uncharacterized membrane protein